MKQALLFIIFLISSTFCCQAQKAEKYDFKDLDDYVASLGPLDGFDLQAIIDTITHPCFNQICQLRAVYDWLGYNVNYDTKNYHHHKQYSNSATEVLNSRKAIDFGYTTMFKTMCDLIHVKCVIIDGIAKNDTKSIGKPSKRDKHVWCAVLLDNHWRLIDPTWAAGTTDRRVKVFDKAFTDAWFMPDPNIFVLCHYPKDKKWQLIDSPVSKPYYTMSPVVRPAAIVNDIYPSRQMRGNIRGKQDTTRNLVFTIKDPELIQSVSFGLKDDAPVRVPFTVKKDELLVTTPYFKKRGNFPVTVFINNSAAYSYKAHVAKRLKKHKKHKKKKTNRHKPTPPKPATAAPLPPETSPPPAPK